MKIGNPADVAGAGPLTQASPASGEAAKAGRAAAGAAPDESAKVELSSAAESLRSGAAGGEFDADKVARVRQAIEDGSFKVNAEVIADKLLANAQEALGRVSGG